ncbi:hypothetical protein RB2604 [Rhodopirellula baltica SH 1]|uniref:Uncharacterized protein n=1 Tax=Rhodopirellula baltica (strain DSM 10527 / NCIMB 13988 / SH1) TaxID=243090 RepID=Q7UVI9_RHOBA|nr:hypothetical protein RB2604 [Rhodopirellula baltica SH 1]
MLRKKRGVHPNNALSRASIGPAFHPTPCKTWPTWSASVSWRIRLRNVVSA